MPFCPKCRFEYLPHIHRCPDCGSLLVGKLPEEPAEPEYGQGPGYEQVVLCVVEGEIQARLLQNALTAQGIHTRLQAEGDPITHSVYGMFPVTNERPMRIYVNQRDLDQARKVYLAWQAGLR